MGLFSKLTLVQKEDDLTALLTFLRELSAAPIPRYWFLFYWAAEWLLQVAGIYSEPSAALQVAAGEGTEPGAEGGAAAAGTTILSLRQEVGAAAWQVASKYLKAAEEESPPDPARVFYTASHLGELTAMGYGPAGFTVGELEDVIEKRDAGAQGCRAWLPPLMRKATFNRSYAPAEVVRRTRNSPPSGWMPADYRDLEVTEAPKGIEPVKGPIFRQGVHMREPKVCASCGARGHNHARCGGCKQVYYCVLSCQRRHWAAGHKIECRRAAAAAGASGPATPAP